MSLSGNGEDMKVLVAADVEPAAQAMSGLADKAEATAERVGTALKQVDAAAKAVNTSAGKMASDYVKDSEAMAQAATKAGQSTSSYVQALEAEVAVLGKTRGEIAAYTAAQEGLTKADRLRAVSLGQQIDAYHQAEAAAKATARAEDLRYAASDKFIAQLKDQAATQGLNTKQLLEYRAAQLGVTKEAAPFIEAVGKAEQAQHGLSFATAGARRELIVVAHELANGQWNQAATSMSVLAERTDALSLVMSPTGGAVVFVAAAITGLAVAAVAGSHDLEHFNKTVALTGNYAGLTKGEFNGMATAIAAGADSSIGKAKDVMQGLADSGRFAASTFDLVAGTAAKFAVRTSQSADEVVKDFTRMGDGVVAWATEHNKQYHFLTAAQWDHINTLDKEGEKELAIMATMAALNEHLTKNAEHITLVGRAWRSTGQWFSEYWDMLKRLTSSDTLDDSVTKMAQRLVAAQDQLAKANPDSPYFAALKKSVDELTASYGQLQAERLKGVADAKEKSAFAEAQQNAQKAIEWNKKLRESAESLADQEKRRVTEYEANQRIIAAADQSQIDTAEQRARALKKIHEDVYGKPSKAQQPTFENDQAKAYAQYFKDFSRNAADAQAKTQLLTKSQAELAVMVADPRFQQMPEPWKLLLLAAAESAASIEEATRATKGYEDQLNALSKAGDAVVKNLDAQIARQKQHNAEIGKTKEQVELARQATEDALTAELQGQADAITLLIEKGMVMTANGAVEAEVSQQARGIYAEVLKNLNEQIARRKELAGLYNEGAAAEAADAWAKASEKAAKQADAAWQRTADNIGDGLTNAILDGGRRGWERLQHDALKWVLRVAVQPIANFGASLLNGVAGQGSGGSGLASAFGLGQAGYGAYTGTGMYGAAGNYLFGSGAAAGWEGGAAAGSVLGGTELASGVTEIASFTSAGAEIGGGAALAAEGGGLAATEGTLASMGPYGWVAAAVVALLAMAGGGGTPTSSTGDSNATFDPLGNKLNANVFSAADTWAHPSEHSEGVVAGLESSYLAAAAKLGIGAVATNFSYSGNTGENGQHPNFGLGGSAGDSAFYQSETTLSDDAVKLAASRALVAALKGSDVPQEMQALFDSITPATATQAQIDTVLAAAQAIADFHAAVAKLPPQFDALKNLSYDDAKSLVAFAGGLDQFAASANGYFNDFATAAEKHDALVAGITQTLVDAGANLTAADVAGVTRDTYTSLVTQAQQNLATEAGRKWYAALLSVEGAVNQLVPAQEAQAETAKDAADALKVQLEWQDKLDVLQGRTTDRQLQLRDALASTTDPAVQSTIRLVFALEDLAEANSNAASAARDATSAAITAAQTSQAMAISAAQGETDSAFAGVQRAIAAKQQQLADAREVDLQYYQDQIEMAQAAVSALEPLSQALHQAMETLKGVQLGPLASRQSAQAQIQTALAIAKAGGPLPDAQKLQGALSTVSQGQPELFSNREAYLRDAGHTAAALAELSKLTDDSLTAEQKALKLAQAREKATEQYYKWMQGNVASQLDAAQHQINLLRGIADGTTSVGAAIDRLTAAIAGERAVTTQASVGGQFDAFTTAMSGKSGVSTYTDADRTRLAGNDPEQARQLLAGIYSAVFDPSQPDGINQTKLAGYADALASLATYYAKVDHSKLDGGTLAFAKKLGLPGFAGGTASASGLYVAGEGGGPEIIASGQARVWNAAQTRSILGGAGGGGHSGALLAEMRNFNRALDRFAANSQAENRAIARNTLGTHQLLVRVTRKGRALQVEDAT